MFLSSPGCVPSRCAMINNRTRHGNWPRIFFLFFLFFSCSSSSLDRLSSLRFLPRVHALSCNTARSCGVPDGCDGGGGGDDADSGGGGGDGDGGGGESGSSGFLSVFSRARWGPIQLP